MACLTRRCCLLLAAAAGSSARAAGPAGPVLLMRHARTEPGVGDPPGFVLGHCATQRNLSAEGRVQARAFGARLAVLGLRPAAIRSSRWCRCLHTGDEVAAGLGRSAPKTDPWSALDSFFDDRGQAPEQTARLLARLGEVVPAGFELWITHQVNITALSGGFTAMGQAHWIGLRPDRSVVATPFE